MPPKRDPADQRLVPAPAAVLTAEAFANTDHMRLGDPGGHRAALLETLDADPLMSDTLRGIARAMAEFVLIQRSQPHFDAAVTAYKILMEGRGMLFLTPRLRAEAVDDVRRDMVENRGTMVNYACNALLIRYVQHLRDPTGPARGGAVMVGGAAPQFTPPTRPIARGGRIRGGGRGGGGPGGRFHRPPPPRLPAVVAQEETDDDDDGEEESDGGMETTVAPGAASAEEVRAAMEAVASERWSSGHARRRARVLREKEELGGLTWEESAAVLLGRWRGRYASSTVESQVQTLRDLAREAGAPRAVDAAWAIVRRMDCMPRAAPGGTPTAQEVRGALEKTSPTTAAAAVIAAFACGGARYTMVRAMRRGDISPLPEGGVRLVLWAEKRAQGRRRVFDVTGWEAQRLLPYAEEATADVPWRLRPHIFDTAAAQTAAVHRARALRRAVAEAMLAEGGERAAAGVLGNQPRTVLTSYVQGEGEDAANWGRVRRSLAMPKSREEEGEAKMEEDGEGKEEVAMRGEDGEEMEEGTRASRVASRSVSRVASKEMTSSGSETLRRRRKRRPGAR